MKKGEMITLRNVLNQLRNEEGYQRYPIKFCYAVERTLDHMKAEVEGLQKIETTLRSEHLKKFDEEREALIKEYGKEQPNGSIAVDEKDEAAMEAFTKGFDAIKEKYKKAIDKFEKAMDEYQKDILQGEDAEAFVHSVSIDKVPEDLPRPYLQILSNSTFGFIVD